MPSPTNDELTRLLPPDGVVDPGGESALTLPPPSLEPTVVLRSLFLFVLAGFAEIGGGYLVWRAVRGGQPWPWAAAGSAVLILYGFVSTLQPAEALDSFGRVYAIYGGFFIVMSALWGWRFDGDKPDAGDVTGCAIALAGVMIIFFGRGRIERAIGESLRNAATTL